MEHCLGTDSHGLVVASGLHMAGLVLKPDEHQPFESAAVEQVVNAPVRVQEVLAASHSLAVLRTQLVGDPLDRQLFVASGWQLSQVKSWHDPCTAISQTLMSLSSALAELLMTRC